MRTIFVLLDRQSCELGHFIKVSISLPFYKFCLLQNCGRLCELKAYREKEKTSELIKKLSNLLPMMFSGLLMRKREVPDTVSDILHHIYIT